MVVETVDAIAHRLVAIGERMSTWDKVSLRFIALVFAVVVLGYGIKFVADVVQASNDMSPEHVKAQDDAIVGK
jgi:hypothetical protein